MTGDLSDNRAGFFNGRTHTHTYTDRFGAGSLQEISGKRKKEKGGVGVGEAVCVSCAKKPIITTTDFIPEKVRGSI